MQCACITSRPIIGEKRITSNEPNLLIYLQQVNGVQRAGSEQRIGSWLVGRETKPRTTEYCSTVDRCELQCRCWLRSASSSLLLCSFSSSFSFLSPSLSLCMSFSPLFRSADYQPLWVDRIMALVTSRLVCTHLVTINRRGCLSHPARGPGDGTSRTEGHYFTGPVTRVGPTGARPQQKSSGLRRK